MIINEDELKNIDTFKEDIIAIKRSNSVVEIVKNHINGEIGLFTIEEYNILVKKSLAKAQKEKIKEDFENSNSSNTNNHTNNTFGSNEDYFIDFEETFSNMFNNLFNTEKENTPRIFDPLIKDISTVVDILAINQEIYKLEQLLFSATDMGVSTKGFRNKIKNKIEELNNLRKDA